MTEADVQFRDDAALLKHQRRIFERPAFKVSCVWELFLQSSCGPSMMPERP